LVRNFVLSQFNRQFMFSVLHNVLSFQVELCGSLLFPNLNCCPSFPYVLICKPISYFALFVALSQIWVAVTFLVFHTHIYPRVYYVTPFCAYFLGAVLQLSLFRKAWRLLSPFPHGLVKLTVSNNFSFHTKYLLENMVIPHKTS